MISHQYRCIFIHIPRCAGSSIEAWIIGKDWWQVDPPTKHLTAHQARGTYAEFWDDYFKFSFVREPIDRMVSCLKYPDHFGLTQNGPKIDFSGYRERFQFGTMIMEHDHRFTSLEDLPRSCHQDGAIYGNMLDEELDFIGRFETLKLDTSFVAEKLGIKEPFLFHHQSSSHPLSVKDLSEDTRDDIHSLFDRDYQRFGYTR